ncbi:MAG: hypothetical protein WBB64_07310 [Anaerolineales bacterium]
MKRVLFAAMVLLLVFIPMRSQEIEEEALELNEVVLGIVPTDSLSTQAASHPYVKALCIGLANFFPSQSDWAILDFCTQWSSAQKWDIVFSAVNYSYKDVPIKVELELMYKNGGTRFYKKYSRTIQAGYIMLYSLDVTEKIRTKGLFTVSGRISGTGLGNSNEVTTQVYVY